jgi:hypothetical protein
MTSLPAAFAGDAAQTVEMSIAEKTSPEINLARRRLAGLEEKGILSGIDPIERVI